MLLQDYLRNGGTPESLTEKCAVKSRRHGKYNNLVQFKYHMIDSPMGDPLVQECRGVILDEANDWAVVARPYDKFFNHGEGHAKPLDWNSIRVQEKLDGSLMIMYWYDGAWQVASSGTPDAGGEVNGCGFTFAELFWRTFKEANYELPEDSYQPYCFMFELMTHYNRVVVQHAEPRLVLIGVRATNGVELPVRDFYGFDWQIVKEFPLQSLADIEASYESISPLSQEGYVVLDDNFNRVKMKHPGYVALHHMRDGMSPRRILEVIRSGETSEVLVSFPEWTDEFAKVQAKYDELLAHLEVEYARLRDIPVQKDFALEAVKTRLAGCLFALRKGSLPTVRSYLADIAVDSLAKTLGLKTDEAALMSGSQE